MKEAHGQLTHVHSSWHFSSLPLLEVGSFSMHSTASQQTLLFSLRTTQYLQTVLRETIWCPGTSPMHNCKIPFHTINTRFCEMGLMSLQPGWGRTLYNLWMGMLESGKFGCHCTCAGSLRPAKAWSWRMLWTPCSIQELLIHLLSVQSVRHWGYRTCRETGFLSSWGLHQHG